MWGARSVSCQRVFYGAPRGRQVEVDGKGEEINRKREGKSQRKTGAHSSSFTPLQSYIKYHPLFKEVVETSKAGFQRYGKDMVRRGAGPASLISITSAGGWSREMHYISQAAGCGGRSGRQHRASLRSLSIKHSRRRRSERTWVQSLWRISIKVTEPADRALGALHRGPELCAPCPSERRGP
ncbi:unnamed protein product [Boreogadus saida]